MHLRSPNKAKRSGSKFVSSVLQSLEENDFKVLTSLSEEYIERCQTSVTERFL